MSKYVYLLSFLFVFILPPELPTVDSDVIAQSLNITTTTTDDSTSTVTLFSSSLIKELHPLYETFTLEELDLLFRVVECEARGGSVEVKANVASVIFNRWRTGWDNRDLTEILMRPRQFEVVTLGLYKTAEITESTIRGCEIAFEQDTVDGAIYFDCTDGKSWAGQECKKGNLIWVMRDDINHDFYRRKRKGE